MFKNREIRIRVAKTDDNVTPPTKTENQLTPEDVNKYAKELLKNIAIATAAVIVVSAVVTVIEEIAIHHGTKK